MSTMPKSKQDQELRRTLKGVLDAAGRDALYLAQLSKELAAYGFSEEDVIMVVVAAASNLPDFDEVCEDCAERGEQ